MIRKVQGKTVQGRLALVILSLGMMMLAGCGSTDVAEGSLFNENQIAMQSLEGLILEGEGPIPARLVYQSKNSISSEEDRLVLVAISLELDRLMELASRLDDAIAEETEMTDLVYPDALQEEREHEEVSAYSDALNANRFAFLETRMEVVRQANEAKQRIAKLTEGNTPGSKPSVTHQRDLEAIREAQRVLAAMLSDIVNAISITGEPHKEVQTQMHLSPEIAQSVYGEPGSTDAADLADATGRADTADEDERVDRADAVDEADGSGEADLRDGAEGADEADLWAGVDETEDMVEKPRQLSVQEIQDYLLILSGLYAEKTQQLSRVVDALSGVVILVLPNS